MPTANLKIRWTNPVATTSNIMEAIKTAHKHGVEQTEGLAKLLRSKYGKNDVAICREIHRILKDEITYVEDKENQIPRTPAAFWATKEGDCKSYSLFACGILCNLGIRNAYRFVAWDNVRGRYTHVYTIAHINGKEIIIDGVWEGQFNTQKRYTQKLDKFNMPVGYMTGMGANKPTIPPASALKLDKGYYHGIVTNYGEEVMDMLLLKEQMEILKEIAAERAPINGIGATNKAISMLDARLAELNAALDGRPLQSNGQDFAATLNKLNASRMKGIGASIGKTNFFTKVVNTVKKVTKGAAEAVHKVIATPLRGVLEVSMPKAAGAFLYTFLSDAEAAKYGQAVQQKRRKQQKLFNTIADVAAMKKEHLTKILRNGFLKKNRMQPEEYLKQLIGAGKPAAPAYVPTPGNVAPNSGKIKLNQPPTAKPSANKPNLTTAKPTAIKPAGKKINGYGSDDDEQIGVISLIAITGLLAALGPIIQAISKIFGKKVEAPSEADMPSEKDFGVSDYSNGGESTASGESPNNESGGSGGNANNNSGGGGTDTSKDNTLMYVGLGVGGLFLAYMAMNNGNK